jgi:hypothetical protein
VAAGTVVEMMSMKDKVASLVYKLPLYFINFTPLPQGEQARSQPQRWM